MNIAVIPARGGSKRIPKKNIKTFCGKPIISWSIEAASAAKVFDHILVSTDDREIAAVAKHYGADVPFLRPAELSDDYVGTTEVIAHATQWCIDQGWDLRAVCCIYATAPFVRHDEIAEGLRLLESGKWAFALTVTDFPAPIFRSFKRNPEGGLEMFFPEHFNSRSQDLPEAFHDAGQFYWGRPSSWLEGKRLFGAHTIPLIIPRWRVQDIDNLDDWKRAELIAKQIVSGT
jgi:pseudaminic acid cytidylyltransferase